MQVFYSPWRKYMIIKFPALTLFRSLTQFSWKQVNVTEWKSCRVKLSCWSQQPPAFQLCADWLGFFTPADRGAHSNIYIYVHILFCLSLSLLSSDCVFTSSQDVFLLKPNKNVMSYLLFMPAAFGWCLEKHNMRLLRWCVSVWWLRP